METIVEYFSREGRTILQAPATFVGALAICAGIVWAAFNWAYSSRFEGQASTLLSLEGRLRLKDDQIADYKDKLSGATPTEAKKRIEALELRVAALSPRRLSDEQKGEISRSLAGSSGIVSIASDMAVPDAKPLAADLAAAFQAAGWQVSLPMFMGLGDPPLSGIGLRVIDATHLPPIAIKVRDALKRSDVVFDIKSGAEPQRNLHTDKPSPDIEIEVTNRSR